MDIIETCRKIIFVVIHIYIVTFKMQPIFQHLLKGLNKSRRKNGQQKCGYMWWG